MRSPINYNLWGDRGVALSEKISIVGRDFTGATFRAQVRLFADAPGSPLITPSVSLTYGGTDTIANHIAAGRLTSDVYDYYNPSTGIKYQPSDSVPMSLMQISISAANMVAPGVPAADELGDDRAMYWDLLIDPAGGELEDKWIYGKFIVRGTVTT